MTRTSRAVRLGAVLAILGGLPAGAVATTITVTTPKDAVAADGACGLREAVTAANLNIATPGAGECPAGAAAGSDVIRLSPGVFVLTRTGSTEGEDLNGSGDLDIRGSLSIVGAGRGATTIEQHVTDRVIDIPGIPGLAVVIDGVTITGGVGAAGAPGASVVAPPGSTDSVIGATGGPGGSGAGIRNRAALTLVASAVVGNVGGAGGQGGDGTGALSPNGVDGRPGSGGDGGPGGVGGIDTAGTLIVRDSVVAQNAGGAGGPAGTGRGGSSTGGLTGADGGYSEGGAGGSGGTGGMFAAGEVTITDSAITDNASGAGGRGGDAFGGAAAGGGAGGTGGQGQGRPGGTGGTGGGIAVVGNVVMERIVVARNVTGPGGQGGNGRGGAGAGAGDVGAGVGGSGGAGGAGGGLALFNVGRTITNATIAGNTTGGGGGGGGGGFGFSTGGPGSAGGAGGSGGQGGGIFNGSGLTLVHATVAGNGSGGSGTTGHAILTGGPGSPGAAGVPGVGEGIRSEGSTLLVRTIVSGNRCDGTFFVQDGGSNVAFGAVGCVGGAGDPRLGALADNGGPGPTMKPGAGGSALDKAPGTGCPATDGRGARRPVGAGCDIGAYEVAPPLATTGGASNLTGVSASAEGTVDTRGLATTVRVQFGPTDAYGRQSAAATVPGALTVSPVAVSLAGLTPRTTYHYRLVATGPDGTATGADRTLTTPAAAAAGAPGAPRVTRLRIAPKAFAVGAKGAPVRPRTRRLAALGAVVRFRLSERASVRLLIQRTVPGRRTAVRRGRTRCVAVATGVVVPRRSRCVLHRGRGSLVRAGTAGANRVVFTGRVRGRALASGPYRLVVIATDATRARSRPVTVGFTVIGAGRS